MSSETSPITQLVNRSEAIDNLRQAQIYELPDLTVHLSKLDSNICFMPGNIDCNIGSLLKCSSSDASRSCLVPAAANCAINKAAFVRKLRSKCATHKAADSTLFEVVALTFMPNNDCAVLGTTKKFIKIFETGLVCKRTFTTQLLIYKI
jgi:hypothetical protein